MCLSVYPQTGLLRRQVGAPADGPQLDGGHGAADVEVLAIGAGRFHLRDAVGAADGLRGVLPTKRRVCFEATWSLSLRFPLTATNRAPLLPSIHFT